MPCLNQILRYYSEADVVFLENLYLVLALCQILSENRVEEEPQHSLWAANCQPLEV